jgi:chromosome segregation protein
MEFFRRIGLFFAGGFEELTKIKEENEVLSNQISEVRGENEGLKDQIIESLEKEKNSLLAEKNDLEEEIEILKEKKQKLKRELAAVSDDESKKKLENELEKIKGELKTNKVEVRDLQIQIDNIENALRINKSEYVKDKPENYKGQGGKVVPVLIKGDRKLYVEKSEERLQKKKNRQEDLRNQLEVLAQLKEMHEQEKLELKGRLKDISTLYLQMQPKEAELKELTSKLINLISYEFGNKGRQELEEFLKEREKNIREDKVSTFEVDESKQNLVENSKHDFDNLLNKQTEVIQSKKKLESLLKKLH